jgi:hypothetical protein
MPSVTTRRVSRCGGQIEAGAGVHDHHGAPIVWPDRDEVARVLADAEGAQSLGPTTLEDRSCDEFS